MTSESHPGRWLGLTNFRKGNLSEAERQPTCGDSGALKVPTFRDQSFSNQRCGRFRLSHGFYLPARTHPCHLMTASAALGAPTEDHDNQHRERDQGDYSGKRLL
jgi:hypothetical protein